MTQNALVATVTDSLERHPSVGWEEVVGTFIESRDSANTQRAYRRHLTAFFAYAEVNTVADLNVQILTGYRAMLINDETRGPASTSQALAALRRFLSWSRPLGAHRLPGDVVTELLRTPKTVVRKPYSILTDDEVDTLVDTADNTRDKAILMTMLGGGLRVSEVVNLDVGDLSEDTKGPVLHVRSGKGRKDRVVPVLPQTGDAIKDYLVDTGRKAGDAGPMFLTHDRGAETRGVGRMSARSVHKLVARLIDRAGVLFKSISPHSLRHTFSIRYLNNDGNIVALAKVLGHASIVTTQKYLDHLELAELRRGIPKIGKG